MACFYFCLSLLFISLTKHPFSSWSCYFAGLFSSDVTILISQLASPLPTLASPDPLCPVPSPLSYQRRLGRARGALGIALPRLSPTSQLALSTSWLAGMWAAVATSVWLDTLCAPWLQLLLLMVAWSILSLHPVLSAHLLAHLPAHPSTLPTSLLARPAPLHSVLTHSPAFVLHALCQSA